VAPLALRGKIIQSALVIGGELVFGASVSAFALSVHRKQTWRRTTGAGCQMSRGEPGKETPNEAGIDLVTGVLLRTCNKHDLLGHREIQGRGSRTTAVDNLYPTDSRYPIRERQDQELPQYTPPLHCDLG